MWPVASFPQSFPKTFFGKPQSSLLTGSRSCQVSNGIKGSNATDYAGLRLDCTGGPAILFPFFAQSAEEPFRNTRLNILEKTSRRIGKSIFLKIGNFMQHSG